jgi:hypothetical protein
MRNHRNGLHRRIARHPASDLPEAMVRAAALSSVLSHFEEEVSLHLATMRDALGDVLAHAEDAGIPGLGLARSQLQAHETVALTRNT